MVDLVPCRYCKCKKAETFKVGDLWYVRCRGTKKVTKKVKDKDGNEITVTETKKCTSWNVYEFLGMREKDAAESWNSRNSGNNKEDLYVG